MGSWKDDPMLRNGNHMNLLAGRQIFSIILIASTLSIALIQAGAASAQSGEKKSGLEPVAASTPSSKAAMSDPGVQKALPPKADVSKVGASSASKQAESKAAPVSDNDDKAEKLPFPVISSDNVGSLSGVRATFSRIFPSAIDIHGSSTGVLLHARKETKYDLLSPLSIWLEDGPLFVSVRAPSELVLVATKFGDICVSTGGDALVDRFEETLRIVNLSTNETVFLNMHDKLWTNSPWGHLGKVQQITDKNNKRKKTYDDIDSGALSIEPGYELIIGSEPLRLDEVKRPDGIGRRDFKALANGTFVVDEISIEHLSQGHDLIKNLKEHGSKASSIFSDLSRSANQLKSRQGDSGFEKVLPPPPKPEKPVRKPPATAPKAPPSTITKPKQSKSTSTAPSSSPALPTGPSAPPANPSVPINPPPSRP